MTAKPLTFLQTTWLATGSAIQLGLRQGTVILLGGMFLAMVLVSAYLGWSATETVNSIYQKAVPVLQAQGATIPANPVGDAPPLSLFRNMITYVALLGALAALVLGFQSVAGDRKSGVLPLYFSRAINRKGLAFGKFLSLAIIVVGVLAISFAIGAAALLVLPGVTLNMTSWIGLVQFHAVSALYMLAFATLGAVCATTFRSESMALLVPVTIWLALTFIVPQLTANIGPMAALNPVSANLVAPDSPFFRWSSSILGPLSIAEAYRFVAASVLGVASGAGTSTSTAGALTSLAGANVLLIILLLFTFNRLDATRSGYND